MRAFSSKRFKGSRSSSRRQVAQIAKKVAQRLDEQNRITLCKRNYLFGDYEAESNRFGIGDDIAWEGKVVELSNIRPVDVDFRTTAVQADDPDTMVDESVAIGDASGTGYPTLGLQGRRRGLQVKVVGGDFNLRALVSQLDVDTGGSDLCPKVKIKFGLYAWSAAGMETADPLTGDFPEPDAKALCRLPTFGYTKELDLVESALGLRQKIRKLCEGFLVIDHKIQQRSEVRKKISFKLARPLMIEFDGQDQTGQIVKNWKIFACIRSDVPADTQTVDYSANRPVVNAVTRLFYVDA